MTSKNYGLSAKYDSGGDRGSRIQAFGFQSLRFGLDHRSRRLMALSALGSWLLALGNIRVEAQESRRPKRMTFTTV